MSEIQTNFETDPYDDDVYQLGSAQAVRVIDVGKKTRNEAPEYGSWQTLSVPLLGVSPPAQLLQRRPLRYRARLYMATQDELSSSVSSTGLAPVTDPGAGATIANVNGLTAGTYQISAAGYLSGTVQAADQDNMKLVNSTGFTTLSKLLVPPAANVMGQPVTVTLTIPVGVTSNILVASNNAGSNAAVIYAAWITVTQIGGPEAIFIASNPGQLVNPTAEGAYQVPLNTFIDWYSQQPCYAIATGAASTINVNDESFGDDPRKSDE